MTKLKVEGMTCGGCVRSVERALKLVDAEAHIEVELESGDVRLESAKDPVSFVAALERAGFKAEVQG